jgi:hypothetical protein
MGMFEAMGQNIGSMGNLYTTQQGAEEARKYLNSAQTQYQDLANQGIGALNSGMDKGLTGYSPYQNAGQNSLAGQMGAIGQMQGAQPQQSGAFSFDTFKDPSAQYSMDQSNRALQSSAVAKGAGGGGLATALQRNSANLATQNYGNAYQRYLQQNQQDFGQQQQKFSNLGNIAGQYGNVSGMGLNAAQGAGNLGLGYNQAINQNYLSQAGNASDIQQGKAMNAQGLWNQQGKNFTDVNQSGGKTVDESPWGKIVNMGGMGG